MKQPYLNREQRTEIYRDTFIGAHLMLNLTIKKSLQKVYKKEGWIAMKKTERKILRCINMILLGRDAPRKWYNRINESNNKRLQGRQKR